MKAISYALFGYGKERNANSFDFDSYLRGLMVNVRMNRLLYHEWETVLHLDHSTYEGFKYLFDNIGIKIVICDDAPLCKAMLWRMKPCFDNNYTHVICRDTDSPATFREVQAVFKWIQHDKGAHAITDSISHNLPMMGGMIGFRPQYFFRTKFTNWEQMVNSFSIDWNVKGSDQTFLTKVIYPCFAQPGNDSITQHYCLGYGNTFLSDWHNNIPDVDVGLPDELKESNSVCGHIGSAGYYSTALERFLGKYKDQFNDLREVEKQYPTIFYWANTGII